LPTKRQWNDLDMQLIVAESLDIYIVLNDNWHMPRIKRCRIIHGQPGAWYFKPRGIPMSQLETAVLEMDEFEALRLADLEKLYQADAAESMGVSRQSFALTLKSAREKVAAALVGGLALEIRKEQRPGNPCFEV
jgi:predicted DNA-binding protein (UPF0251 family)